MSIPFFKYHIHNHRKTIVGIDFIHPRNISAVQLKQAYAKWNEIIFSHMCQSIQWATCKKFRSSIIYFSSLSLLWFTESIHIKLTEGKIKEENLRDIFFADSDIGRFYIMKK